MGYPTDVEGTGSAEGVQSGGTLSVCGTGGLRVSWTPGVQGQAVQRTYLSVQDVGQLSSSDGGKFGTQQLLEMPLLRKYCKYLNPP